MNEFTSNVFSKELRKICLSGYISKNMLVQMYIYISTYIYTESIEVE